MGLYRPIGPRAPTYAIKETSDPDYFLGGYFKRVKDPNTDNKILTWGSKIYVKQMIENFKNTFGFDPSKQHSTIPPDYNRKLYTTKLFADTEKAQYWQCIGEMQWSVALYQIDIMYATVDLS